MADSIVLTEARAFALETLRNIQRERDLAEDDLLARRDRIAEQRRDDFLALRQEETLRNRVADLQAERGDIALDQQEINVATVGLDSLEQLGSQLRAVISFLPEAETPAERDSLAQQFDVLRDQFDSVIRDTTFLGRNPLRTEAGFETSEDLGLGDRDTFNNFDTTVDVDNALTALDNLLAGVRQSQETVSQDAAVLRIRDDFNRDLANVALEGADRLRDDDSAEAVAQLLAADLRRDLTIEGQRIVSGSDDLLRSILEDRG